MWTLIEINGFHLQNFAELEYTFGQIGRLEKSMLVAKGQSQLVMYLDSRLVMYDGHRHFFFSFFYLMLKFHCTCRKRHESISLDELALLIKEVFWVKAVWFFPFTWILQNRRQQRNYSGALENGEKTKTLISSARCTW